MQLYYNSSYIFKYTLSDDISRIIINIFFRFFFIIRVKNN